jgi:hypothetical protein
MLFAEGREAIRVHPCVVDRTTFLLFANRAIAGIRMDRRLIIVAVADVLRRRARTRSIARVGLRAVGYQLGAGRVGLRASSRRHRDRCQADRRKSQACDNSWGRRHSITFLIRGDGE